MALVAQKSPRLLLTKVPTDWGAPNYLRLWLRSDKIVPDGMLTFRIRLRNPDTQKGRRALTDATADKLCGLARIFVGLAARFPHHG
jgi:hypothetical protein